MTASTILLISAIALIGGTLFFVFKSDTFYFLALGLITIFVGIYHYYFGDERSYWLASIICIVCAAKFFIEAPWRATHMHLLRHGTIMFLVAFLAWGVFASLLGGISQTQALLAIKNYFAIWLVVIPAIWLGTRSRPLDRFEKFLFLLLVLQLPFAVVQNLSTTNWDAVVGTFGGNPEGGGASGTLMIYVIVGLLVSVAWWQRGKMSGVALLATLGLVFLIVIQGEVKAFFFLLPLAIFVSLRRIALTRPAQSAALALVMALGSYVTLGLYDEKINSTSVGRTESLENSIEYFFDTTFVSLSTGEVSRGASVALWYEEGGNTTERLVGYGLGASRLSATVDNGSVAKRFGQIAINSTTMAQLLWDTGLIGTALFIGIFVSAFRQALRISRQAPNQIIRARADFFAGVIVLAFPLLIYDRSLVDGPAIHFLFASCIGLLCGLERSAKLISHREHQQAMSSRVGQTSPALVRSR